MMANRIALIVVVFVSVCLASPAQDLSDILFGKGNKTDYIGQYNYNGKRKNGFGIERYKNGAIYIGDFVEDKVSGRGMLISQKKGIDNVENAVVYVGIWRDGKKNGRGTCYDASGNVVFRGKFVNDKPSEASSENVANMHFVITDIDNSIYLGEMRGNVQDGFGLTLQESGEIVFSTIKNNVRQGIGMVFYSPVIWEVGRWSDGIFSAFNNSQAANADIQSFRASNKEFNKEVRSSLFEAASNFGAALSKGVEIAEMTRHHNNDSFGINETSDDSNSLGTYSSSKKSSASNATSDRDATWMRGNYQSQKAVYSNYETQIIKAKNDPDNNQHTIKNLKNIQRKMKQIRETIVSHGGTCSQSQWETWQP